MMTNEDIRVIRHWQRLYNKMHDDAVAQQDTSAVVAFYNGRRMAIDTLVDVLHVPEID